MTLKKVLLIYNPLSGNRNITTRLDFIIEYFSEHSIILIPYRLIFSKDPLLLSILKTENIDCVIISGGDGTVNYIVNILLVNKVKIPIGLIPAGTCNDLSRCLGLPLELKPALDKIYKENVMEIDVGHINNEHYFLSTCAGGVFVDVSFNTSSELKRSFGPLAYYFKAMSEVPTIKGFDLKIKTDDIYIKDKFFLFIILNGEHVAGFTNVLKEADITDGYMDIILIKECPPIELAGLFLKAMKNDLLKDKNVIHLKTKTCTIDGKKNIPITVDGEKYSGLPLNVEFKHKILKVLY